MIVNPCAGQRHAVRALGAVIGVLQSGGYRCTVLLTEKSGDGTRLAQQYGGDYDVVVAVGGDGTLNEVVAGMHAGGFSTPLGYLPAGSTNDFASSLGLPGDMSDAAQIIAAGHPHALDVGEFNVHLCRVVRRIYPRVVRNAPISQKFAWASGLYIGRHERPAEHPLDPYAPANRRR